MAHECRAAAEYFRSENKNNRIDANVCGFNFFVFLRRLSPRFLPVTDISRVASLDRAA